MSWRRGSRRALESSILFSFETDFTGRVKARPADRNLAGTVSGGLHASRDSFYRTARGERQHRPGVIPLDLLPRRCPVCRNDTIIGHGRRLRQSHDDQHESHLGAARNLSAVREDLHDLARLARTVGALQLCVADSRPVSGSPPAIPSSKPRRTAKIRSRLPDPSTVRRWAQRRLLSVWCWVKAGRRPTRTFCGHPPSLPGISARSAVFCRSRQEVRESSSSRRVETADSVAGLSAGA